MPDDPVITKRPLITCIMPTYGRPDFVHESVAMFLAQDYDEKELLIVNDCPDQTFAADYPQVRIINCDQRFQSLGEKRNFAIREASGEWIAVWDDDDVYLPWRLSFSIQEACQFQTPLYRPSEYWAYWGESHLHHNQSTPEWISHPVTVFQKSLWDAVGGYPQISLGEDSEFFRKIHQRLRADWLSYPIDEIDRFMILRGHSKYRHTSIAGGCCSPNTTPAAIRIVAQPIDDVNLRDATDRLISTSYARRLPLPLNATCNSWTQGQVVTVAKTFLDDLNPKLVEVGYGALGRHGMLGYEGKRVKIKGRQVRHALSTHPSAEVAYFLDGQYGALETLVGLNDDVLDKTTSADFFVISDGEVVGCATGVTAGEEPRRIEADLEGANELQLLVRTDRWNFCHALWIEPVLLHGGAAPHYPEQITDCLKRAEITSKTRSWPEAELCIATVASPGFEIWLRSFLESLRRYGRCEEALIAVFCFDANSSLAKVAEDLGAKVVECQSLVPINMACKSVLYSVGKVVAAKKFICLDADMLVLGDLRPVVDALDVLPAHSVLLCKDAASVPTLGKALTCLYGSSGEDVERMCGRGSVDLLDYPLVVNDGFFAARRTAINAVDEVIRGFPSAANWVTNKASELPWRNQFLFNLALAKLGAAVKVDDVYNWQLNLWNAQVEVHDGAFSANGGGRSIRCLHFNGGGRKKYSEWRHQLIGDFGAEGRKLHADATVRNEGTLPSLASS